MRISLKLLSEEVRGSLRQLLKPRVRTCFKEMSADFTFCDFHVITHVISLDESIYSSFPT